jgi:hypothetical protein
MRRGLAGVVAVTALTLVLSSCGNEGQKAVTERDFDAGRFTRANPVDNRWFPLTPGTRLEFAGQADRGGGLLPHRVVFTVTDLTKVIDGVRTVVILEHDLNQGELKERELAFHAQDRDGNVWHFGEYPEIWEEGKFLGADDTWIAGLARARPGILMRAEPQVGGPAYLQGTAPDIEFRDRAKDYRTGQRSCVPVRCFSDVLITDEWNPLEPTEGHQRKFYAPGVGTIRVEPRGGPEKETLVLVDIKRLEPAELAAARTEALELDERAYTVSEDIYARTPRAVKRSAPEPAS